MKRFSRSRSIARPLLSTLSAGLVSAALSVAIVPVHASETQAAPASGSTYTWLDALKDTSRTGRTTVVVVTSASLEPSLNWAEHVRNQLRARFGDALNFAEMRAESDPQRVRSLNVRSLPTLLVYRNDGKGGLTLAGYREGICPDEELFAAVGYEAPQARQLSDQAADAGTRRVVRVQRASVSTVNSGNVQQPVAQRPQTAQANGPVPPQDAKVTAATHQYAQSSAQGSPQGYAAEPPAKQLPPAPVKSPPPPPQTYQAPPPQQATQPVYAAPPAQTAQPVYAYVPQQPVYAAPPSASPVMVQPPAGQVVVQPAPLNVTVAPTPPPQVTYMAPSMAPAPMMAPAMAPAPMMAPAPAMGPAPNAFAAMPPQPAMAPHAAPEPAMGVPQPAYGAPQPAMAAGPSMGYGAGPSMGYGAGPGVGFGATPAAGIGSLAMGMMLTNPNILDRVLGGIGRLLSERSYPRIRMNPESPSLFSAPAGMGGFVGINPAMAMAPSPANPLQAYMAVPNGGGGGGGGGDATEAYLKAYIALCKEKGVTPNLPGWEPPAPPPPTGPVPSPQDVQQKKKNWWFR